MVDILYIGYPRAASTFIANHLQSHPQVSLRREYLASQLGWGKPAKSAPFRADTVHIEFDESIAESTCLISGDIQKWQRHLYIPGAWDLLKRDVIVDPWEAASRLMKANPEAKVVLTFRDQVDWLQSLYKYSVSQMPAGRRSFRDYLVTPSGTIMLRAGHFDLTIRAYTETFGRSRVCVLRYADLVRSPLQFSRTLHSFIGIDYRPLPLERDNATHATIVRLLRAFPMLSDLPRPVKEVLKGAGHFLPGARASSVSARDEAILRSTFAVSNALTEAMLGTDIS